LPRESQAVSSSAPLALLLVAGLAQNSGARRRIMWMLVIAVILTVVAWLRGWKWWALLPLGLGVGGGYLVGFVLYSVGPATVPTWSFMLGGMFDVLAILALAVMAVVGRGKRAEKEKPVRNITKQEFDNLVKKMKKELLSVSEQAQKAILELEEELSSVDDDAQLANVDMQNMLQKQQQAM